MGAGIFIILIVVMISWVYTYVKTCQIVHFKYVFIIYHYTSLRLLEIIINYVFLEKYKDKIWRKYLHVCSIWGIDSGLKKKTNHIQILSFPSYVTLGNSVTFPSLSSLICKMGEITLRTCQDCCEDIMR